jgi:ClpP class serine protease
MRRAAVVPVAIQEITGEMKMPKIWLCERSALKTYLETVNRISGAVNIDDGFSDRYQLAMSKPISTRVGRTAVIKVSGLLTEGGPSMWDWICGIGGTSYAKIRQEIGAADLDDAVDDKLMLFDTPGGSVDGVDETWNTIKESGKPTNALVAGMCASGGYYLSSACKTIIARSPGSWIGSIGTVVTDVDDHEFFERYGIYIVEVTSDNAKNKRLSPLTKEGKEELRATVNAYERQFHKRIQEGRGISRDKIIKDFGKGSMFVALDPDPKERDALSRGMIDDVKNGFEDSNQASKTKSKNGSQKTAARENVKEQKMNLEELLKENPGLAAEIQQRIDAAVNEAISDEREKNAQAAKLVEGGKYGASVNKMFSKVVSGAVPLDALETLITTLDAIDEQKRIDAAVDEQEETGAVNSGEAKPKVKVDGNGDDGVDINSEEDIEKAAAALV